MKRLLLVCAIGLAELSVASMLGARPVLAQTAAPKIVIKNETGGGVYAHWTRFRQYRIDNSNVEVLGTCNSACTLILAAIERENLCFGPNAILGFHAAQDPQKSERSLDGTKWMFEKYPEQIQSWLNAHGGINEMAVDKYWFLPAKELWQMGYRKCDVTASTQESEEDKAERIAFTYKRCLAGPNKTFTKEEFTNYCGCWSVLINERVSQEEFDKAAADGTWAQNPIQREVTRYCRHKYGNLPDVTAIRKKQW